MSPLVSCRSPVPLPPITRLPDIVHDAPEPNMITLPSEPGENAIAPSVLVMSDSKIWRNPLPARPTCRLPLFDQLAVLAGGKLCTYTVPVLPAFRPIAECALERLRPCTTRIASLPESSPIVMDGSVNDVPTA